MTLDEYVRAVPAQRRERFDAIRALIKRRYPQADESMRYRMPTFELEGGGWVALANQKQYISLYTCAAQHLEPFKARYPGIKTGKGCINFRQRDEFDLADLEPVVDSAMRALKT